MCVCVYVPHPPIRVLSLYRSLELRPKFLNLCLEYSSQREVGLYILAHVQHGTHCICGSIIESTGYIELGLGGERGRSSLVCVCVCVCV